MCCSSDPSVTAFGNRAYNRVTMSSLSEVPGWGSNPMGLISLEEEEETPEISLLLHAHREDEPAEDTARRKSPENRHHQTPNLRSS